MPVHVEVHPSADGDERRPGSLDKAVKLLPCVLSERVILGGLLDLAVRIELGPPEM